MPVPAASAARLLLLFFLALPDAAVALEPEPTRVGRVSEVEGDTRISYGEDAEASEPAAVNYPVAAGARILVASGARAEIRIGPSALRLNGQAVLDVVTLDERVAQFGLDEGSLNLALRDLYGDERFEIAVPGATITIRAPGSYRIDADPAAESIRITVRAGEALVASEAGENLVRSGRSVSISSAGHIEYDAATAYDLDEFDRWSQDLEAAPPGAYGGYVPETVTGYEGLDQNGTWSTYSGYGAVWTPNAAYGWWAPYTYGSWAWVPNWGWTWVDQAPWAFATFRFGRWVFLDDRWWWAPGAFWPRPALAAYVPFYPGQIIFTTSHFVHGKPARYFVPLKPRHGASIQRPWHRHGWRSAGRHFHGQPEAQSALPTAAAPVIATPALQAAPGAVAAGEAGSGPALQRGARGLPPGIVSPRNRRPPPGIGGSVPAPAVAGPGTAAVAAGTQTTPALQPADRSFRGRGGPPSGSSSGPPADSSPQVGASPARPRATPSPGARAASPGESTPRVFQPGTWRGHGMPNAGLTRSRLPEPGSAGAWRAPSAPAGGGAADRGSDRDRGRREAAAVGRERPAAPNAMTSPGTAGTGNGPGGASRGEGSQGKGGRDGVRGWQRNGRSPAVPSAIVSPGSPSPGFRGGNRGR